jgi:glycogen synthase
LIEDLSGHEWKGQQMRKNLLVAYESRFARCGGITAVLNFLPRYLRASSGITTSVITPFHHRIPSTNTLPVRLVGDLQLPFFSKSGHAIKVNVNVYQYDDGWAWYFLDAKEFVLPDTQRLAKDDGRFFSGRNHPYDVGSNAAEQWSILRRDALFFGAAVARALPLLDANVRWNVIMQDWQAATTALALASNGQHEHRRFLTLHNSYDSGAVGPDDLRAVSIHPERVPGPEEASTVLSRALPLVQKPVFTVSEQFARDMVTDTFQVRVMADHLQRELPLPNLVGVNNGLFVSLAVPEKALAKAREKRPDYSALQEWKTTQKKAAITSLNEFQPTPEKPVWGNKKSFTAQAEKIPWFVLAGRDDTRQKGYDVACDAIRSFLSNTANRMKAQFLFFPIPGDEGQEGLGFLKELANEFQENVLVLPFIFLEGYQAALQGAAFGIMPSLYEPFGMANEFYLNGAIGIGRATGGLVQQIVPLQTAASFTSAVRKQSSKWHNQQVPATGFLYREDDLPNVVKDWRALNDAKYLQSTSRNRLEERKNLGLFKGMAVALKQAIEDALIVYHQPPGEKGQQPYFSLLTNGIAHLQRGFSWDLAAAEYNSYILGG